MKLALDKPFTFHRSNKARLYILLLILLAVGAIGIFGKLFHEMYVDHLAGNLSKKWLGIGIVLSFYCFLFTVFSVKWVRAMLKASESVTIGKNAILLGNEEISYSEIKEISTFDAGRIVNEHYYGILIYMKDGTTKLIAERFYRNAPRLFEIIDKTGFTHRPGSDNSNERSAQEHKTEEEEHFNYNILSSFDSVVGLIFLLSMIFIFLDFIFRKDHPVEFTFATAGMILLFYFLNIRLSYHFIIDNHNLEIKNKFLPGTAKVYRLNEIKAAVIHGEGYGERSGIRIVRTDYTSSFFIASSFRRQKWKSLQEALEKRGVFVVNKLQSE